MSLYYILNKDHYSGKLEEIGDIMEDFNTSLFESTGLSLNLYQGPTEEKLQSYYPGNKDIQVLTEEVLWRNLTDEQKTKKILEYIDQISDDNRAELLIVDPYLFKKPKDGEYDALIEILQSCDYTKIIAVVGKDKVDIDYQKDISDLLGERLTIKYTDEIHDRFWISNRKNGFLTGTSLNGIGKKYCVIQRLELEDVDSIVQILENML